MRLMKFSGQDALSADQNPLTVLELTEYILNYLLVVNNDPKFVSNHESLPFSHYLKRIIDYVALDIIHLMAFIVYFDRFERLRNLNPGIFSLHKFFLTCISISMKCMGDFFYSNSYLAKVGGVKIEELFRMEFHLLIALDWRVQLKQSEIYHVINQVTKTIKS